MNKNAQKLDLPDRAKWLLIIGFLVILTSPILLTIRAFTPEFDFSTTGQIGDTIGGITSPFLNLIASFLLFYALKSQVQANKLVQDQIEESKVEKTNNKEAENLNQLYKYLNDSINAFKFKSLPEDYLSNVEYLNIDTEFSGGGAFSEMFKQIRCHYHGPQHVLEDCPPVSELLSILKIMNLILLRLLNSDCDNKGILITLIRHQFEYKIATNIKRQDIADLEIYFCPDCKCPHGLPEEIRLLVKSIQDKIIQIEE
ncbi:MAG: hypothetical protein EOO89_00725 [Pedobacter sp.]|nr:MAG: hypothetical protein EOO89_00725 [Pedobacter sp.]